MVEGSLDFPRGARPIKMLGTWLNNVDNSLETDALNMGKGKIASRSNQNIRLGLFEKGSDPRGSFRIEWKDNECQIIKCTC